MLDIIQALYDALGIQGSANLGDLLGLGSAGFLTLLSALKFFTKPEDPVALPPVAEPLAKETAEETRPTEEIEKKVQPSLVQEIEEKTPVETIEEVPAKPKISWAQRLKKGLERSRQEVWGKLGSIIGGGSSLTEDQVEELEELLYAADIGPQMVSDIIEELEKRVGQESFDESALKSFLFQFLKEKMVDVQNRVDRDLYQYDPKTHQGTKVVMIVGVNGAGKTTTIGKLATKLTSQGAKVVVGACDTFRAAAVDQLQVWCERAGAEMIRAKENADPSGVAYDAVAKAKSLEADYCLLDTAGRLHTKENLMEELAKNKRVIQKVDDTAPHSVLLVIDSITGQNALKQAENFNKTLDVTGLVFTKCDGSSKAGNAISITQSLKVPITYIGVGESVEDLELFDLDSYLNALLDREVTV